MKNIGFKLVYIITAIVIIAEIVFAVKGSLFTDISDLPTGEKIASYPCESGEKTMNVYLIKNTLGSAIRCEIEKEGDRYNIFWQTGIETVEVVWLSNDEVAINNIPLDANDTFGYDCRRGYSLFDEGSLEQNFTDYE